MNRNYNRSKKILAMVIGDGHSPKKRAKENRSENFSGPHELIADQVDVFGGSSSCNVPESFNQLPPEKLPSQGDKARQEVRSNTSSNISEVSNSDLESLFPGNFSDDDATYRPEREDLITFVDLLESNETSTLTIPNTRNQRRDEQNRGDSKIIASIILMDILALVWQRVKSLKRWRTSEPSKWKKNVAMKRRAEGLPYVTRNKIRPPKVPKTVDCSTCQYKCNSNFSEENRNRICRMYWGNDYVNKKNFILSHVIVAPPKKVIVDRKRSQRLFNTKCYFDIDLERKQVCQRFFCFTLNIAPSVLKDAVQNRNNLGFYAKHEDPRGHHEPPNKTPPEKVQEVIEHIKSFPTMEGHYVRMQSKRKYLDCNLSINKMYELYFAQYKNSNPVSDITYRRIFGKEFNYSFFVPKKDQCLLCNKYKRADQEGKMQLEVIYQEHLERKRICNEEKNKDKERAEKDKTFVSVTFDLQAILQVPSSDIGVLYYIRKLTIYNLTIYESALPNDAYCFTWSEIHGKKGSAEIGSILHHYLNECIASSVTEVSLFSDTCGGQNRNQNIAAILLWSVNKIDHIKVIEQKFLESGHSYMEADSMHSSIETERKNQSINSITEWMNIFRRARSKGFYKVGKNKVKKDCYKVKEFKYYEFKDLKKLSETLIKNRTKDNEGNKIKWLKIKRMRYVKGETKIYFNYDMSAKLLYFDVRSETVTAAPETGNRYGTRKSQKSKKQLVDSPVEEGFTLPELTQLYKDPLPISVAKKRDLVKLCDQGVIPEEYHGWFKSLPCVNTVDHLPDVALSETSSDEEQ